MDDADRILPLAASKEIPQERVPIMPLSTPQLTEGIGFCAAACTTLAFIPQLIKIRRQGGRDLSYGMLWAYLIGLGLWFVYGWRLHLPAVMAANGVALILVGGALLMKRSIEQPLPVPDIFVPEPYLCDNPLGLIPAYPPSVEQEKTQALAYAARHR